MYRCFCSSLASEPGSEMGMTETLLQFLENHLDFMYSAFLHGGIWRSFSLSDASAAEHKSEIILSSLSSVPTKTEGRAFVRSLYVRVGLASSN
ncbi:hypothetical protein OIU76_007040 [Salix suchowensis]|nr:hypothetical protein OIU76_007040 [Salix suchowensis]